MLRINVKEVQVSMSVYEVLTHRRTDRLRRTKFVMLRTKTKRNTKTKTKTKTNTTAPPLLSPDYAWLYAQDRPQIAPRSFLAANIIYSQPFCLLTGNLSSNSLTLFDLFVKYRWLCKNLMLKMKIVLWMQGVRL